MNTKEVMTVGTFELVTITGELAEAVAEEMDGLGAIPFDKVKIPSGGGLAFEVPGEEEDSPDVVKEIRGVIVDHHPVNAFWYGKYDGNNDQPDCASFDGKQGMERETGELHDCASCPHNQYGSDTDGRGKACKNIHRCYILREGNPVPLVLSLPPTSLKYMRDYIGKKILLKGMRCWQAVTKISLKKEKSAGGIEYSRAVFAFESKLTAEQAEQAKQMADVIRESIREPITIEEGEIGSQKPKVNKDGFAPVDPDSVPEFEAQTGTAEFEEAAPVDGV